MVAAEVTRSELGLSPDTPIGNLTNTLEKAGVLILALPITFDQRDAFSLWAGIVYGVRSWCFPGESRWTDSGSTWRMNWGT